MRAPRKKWAWIYKVQKPHFQEFWAHRMGAKRRGIEFRFHYSDWLRVWEESGHLHERGCRRGQFVMARDGDRGAYCSSNVKIVLAEQNVADRWVNRDRRNVGVTLASS
jgi:hypothetical protein